MLLVCKDVNCLLRCIYPKVLRCGSADIFYVSYLNNIFRNFRFQSCFVSFRYGFNSEGHEAVFARLSQLPPPGHRGGDILGINLGKNKTSEDHVKDYTLGVQKFGPLADYLVVNVSRLVTANHFSFKNRNYRQFFCPPNSSKCLVYMYRVQMAFVRKITVWEKITR